MDGGIVLGHWGYWLLLMGVCLLTAALILRLVPASRNDGAMAEGRNIVLDGFRGLLAPSVMFHHMFVRRDMQLPATERVPSTTVFWLLGPMAVTLFFYLTCALFWPRAGVLDPYRFYVRRILRLAPMILVMAYVLAVVAGVFGPERNVSSARLLRELSAFLTLGLVIPRWINGVRVDKIYAEVLWTLQIETLFYILYPLLSTVRKVPKLFWFGIGLFPLYILILKFDGVTHVEERSPLPFVAIFSFWLGLAVVTLWDKYKFTWLQARPWGIVTPLAALASTSLHLVGYQACILMMVAFLPVLAGNDLFGLLRWAPLRWLGAISYGMYLMHGILIYFVDRWVGGLEQFSDPALVGVAALVSVAATALFSLTYLVIEAPAIRFAHRVTQEPSS